MIDVRYQMVMGAVQSLETIQKKYDPAIHGFLGITEEDWTILRLETPWKITEARRARNVFEQILNGALEKSGQPTWQIPMEYVAGAIAILVSGPNIRTACGWSHQCFNGALLVDGNGEERDAYEYVTPSRLMAEVMYCYRNIIQRDLVKPLEEEERAGIQHT